MIKHFQKHIGYTNAAYEDHLKSDEYEVYGDLISKFGNLFKTSQSGDIVQLIVHLWNINLKSCRYFRKQIFFSTNFLQNGLNKQSPFKIRHR